MPRPRFAIRHVLAVSILGFSAASVGAQSHEEFKNLKVLPKDIPPTELRAVMNGFTRALGVRCIYCHVGEEGKPFKTEDFPKDDKPTKAKARVMMQMVKDLNEKYMTTLATRAEPPIKVQCATCHRGVTQPRMLQDVLKLEYDKGGVDSTVARYQALRDRYYGRAAYDFGDVPLSETARQVREAGHSADANALLALNVQMNPKSMFAKRQLAYSAIFEAFATAGPDSGAAKYHQMKSEFGPTVVREELLNDIAYDLLGHDKYDAAIAAFQLNVAENPTSGNSYDSLGEAYAGHGDRKQAIKAYEQSLKLDPTNDNAKQQLEELKKKPKKK